jgi:sterol desaturase/sphingolipid hydroxylase (fatty acid hydroxylase superfamily)
MLGIPVGWAYGHVMEWAIHKYVLHGAGKKRDNFWSFHFHEHHSACRRTNNRDSIYEGHPFHWDAGGKEVFGLALLGLAHLPLLPVAPFFVGTLVYSGVQYYFLHKRSHLDPEWAREHLPWHYDHHMALNQDMNWGVRRDWVDRMMGTRLVYAGTEREVRDWERREAAFQARQVKPDQDEPELAAAAK